MASIEFQPHLQHLACVLEHTVLPCRARIYATAQIEKSKMCKTIKHSQNWPHDISSSNRADHNFYCFLCLEILQRETDAEP